MNISSKELLGFAMNRAGSWADETIKCWEDVTPLGETSKMMKFVTEQTHIRGNIDLRTVVGQFAGHYEGESWRQAFHDPGYKDPNFERLLRQFDMKPHYYFEPMKGHVGFSSIDGKNWYCDGGNHRVVVARFLFDLVLARTGHYPLLQDALLSRFTLISRQLRC